MLVRRAIEPGYGLWVFPGGYVDRGEQILDAALREAREESGLEIRIDRLVNIYSYPGTAPIIIVYAATMVGGELCTDEECLEARLFSADEIPWDELAFRSTTDALRDYFDAHTVEPRSLQRAELRRRADPQRRPCYTFRLPCECSVGPSRPISDREPMKKLAQIAVCLTVAVVRRGVPRLRAQEHADVADRGGIGSLVGNWTSSSLIPTPSSCADFKWNVTEQTGNYARRARSARPAPTT